MEDKGYKFYIEAEMKPVPETIALKKEVASVIDLPDNAERQPDLSYFSSIFVSTGTNLNNAHFLTSELVMAEGTVVSKAVDIEHKEDQVIGHIYSKTFIDDQGNTFDVNDLKEKPISELDNQGLHIAIGSVVYKTRFPEITEELLKGEWSVSMEAYFKSFDIKVGDLILSKDEATALGLDVSDDTTFGKQAKVIKENKVVAEGTLSRVLRGICFSGVGIVKNPANPASVVLDTVASKKEVEDTVIILKDTANNKVTTDNIDNKNNKKPEVKKEEAKLEYKDTVGLCVNYKKELLDSVVKDQDTKVLEKNWCTKYDMKCPVYGDYTAIGCLAKEMASIVNETVEDVLNRYNKEAKLDELTSALVKLLKNYKN